MTPEQEFQLKHGPAWAQMCSGALLGDALVTVNATLLNEIVAMSPEQIQINGVVTLAKLQGQLHHERALIDLSVSHPDYGTPPDETYPDPRDEMEQEQPLRDKSLSFAPSQYQIIPETPQPRQKRKYTRKKKRKSK